MAVPAGWRSLGQREERLAFLDDIGGEDRPLPLPTFLTAWTAPAGTVKASPAWNVLVGWPST